jgi:tetratricopeptide (TPR) repeat protein
MRPTRPLLPVALAAALAWCPSASLAQSAPGPEEAAREQARALLKQGNELLDKGNYLEALQRFEAAYAAFPSPKLLFNIAQDLHGARAHPLGPGALRAVRAGTRARPTTPRSGRSRTSRSSRCRGR